MADVVQNDDVEFRITQVVLHEVAGPQRKLALDAELRHDLLRMRKLIRREMQSTAAVGLRLVPKTGLTIRRSAPERERAGAVSPVHRRDEWPEHDER